MQNNSTQFRYDQDNLFKEFEIAKQKDIKLSKKKSYDDKLNDIHTNRIQFFKDHIELKSKQPEVYDNVDINFENLKLAYESPNPRDHFYMKVFGKSYMAKKMESELEDLDGKDQ